MDNRWSEVGRYQSILTISPTTNTEMEFWQKKVMGHHFRPSHRALCVGGK